MSDPSEQDKYPHKFVLGIRMLIFPLAFLGVMVFFVGFSFIFKTPINYSAIFYGIGCITIGLYGIWGVVLTYYKCKPEILDQLALYVSFFLFFLSYSFRIKLFQIEQPGLISEVHYTLLIWVPIICSVLVFLGIRLLFYKIMKDINGDTGNIDSLILFALGLRALHFALWEYPVSTLGQIIFLILAVVFTSISFIKSIHKSENRVMLGTVYSIVTLFYSFISYSFKDIFEALVAFSSMNSLFCVHMWGPLLISLFFVRFIPKMYQRFLGKTTA